MNTHGAGLSIAGGGFNTSNGFGAFGCGLDPIPSGGTCDLLYTFQPPATGLRTNSTSIQLTTSDQPVVSQVFPIQVQGTGTASVPMVGVAPVAVDFGEITIGRRPVVPVEYTNFDPSQVSVAGGGFNDNDDAFFAVGSGDPSCGDWFIDPDETCATDYSFLPGEARDFAASTSLGFSRTGGYQGTPLSFTGSGIGTLAQVSPTQIVFGDVAPGTDMTVPVTITNTSEAPLTSFVGGGVLSPFSLASNSCGSSLAVGASCQLGYRFYSSDTDPASAQTLLSFTNSSGIQPTFEIRLYANGAPEPGGLALGATALATLALCRRVTRGAGSAAAQRRR